MFRQSQLAASTTTFPPCFLGRFGCTIASMRTKVRRRVVVPFSQYVFLSKLHTETVKYVLPWKTRRRIFVSKVRRLAPRVTSEAVPVLAVALPVAYLVIHLPAWLK